ncbi:MAG: hypothetical protein ACNA8N_12480 [Trueperaceae bacterium]
MRLDIVIDRQHVDDLLRFAGTSDPAEAVRIAVDAYVRRARIDGLMALAGKVDILSNDEIEAADLDQALEAARSDDGFPAGSA